MEIEMKIENCVLGVYETLNGLDIAGEMSIWLKKYYKLFKVTQEPIEGNLCEFPALLFASEFCQRINGPQKTAAQTAKTTESLRKRKLLSDTSSKTAGSATTMLLTIWPSHLRTLPNFPSTSPQLMR